MDAINTGVMSIDKAIGSIGNPEVIQMIEKLSHFGLAVAVPHMHPQKGGFQPLPKDIVAVEEKLHVSFKNRLDIDEDSTIPVMWTWDNKSKSPVVSGGCGLECRV